MSQDSREDDGARPMLSAVGASGTGAKAMCTITGNVGLGINKYSVLDFAHFKVPTEIREKSGLFRIRSC